LSFSVSGDIVERAIYAATIEKLRRTAVPVHLDRQHGAFHGTNPELGWQCSATCTRPSPEPSHDGHEEMTRMCNTPIMPIAPLHRSAIRRHSPWRCFQVSGRYPVGGCRGVRPG
jgi:hypothetical protein